MIRGSIRFAEKHHSSVRNKAQRALSGSRTIVRDPRKTVTAAKKKKMKTALVSVESSSQLPAQQQEQAPSSNNSMYSPKPLPFQPDPRFQESVGSSLGSYVLMGAGVAMGVTFIRLIIG